MKGYLHHYDKTGAKALNTAPLDEVVGQCKKLINGKLIPTPYSTQLHPAKPNVVEFWADLDKNLTAEFKVGDSTSFIGYLHSSPPLSLICFPLRPHSLISN
jgi:hypothetical protein